MELLDVVLEFFEFILELFVEDASIAADQFLEKKCSARNWRTILACSFAFLLIAAVASISGSLWIFIKYDNDFVLVLTLILTFLSVRGMIKVIRIWKNRKKDG